MLNSNLQQIKSLMRQVQTATNPQAALDTIISNNPTLQSFVTLAKNNGSSLEQVARILAQQKGVDINNLIRQLNS